jgi:hypothetical protein
MKTEGELHKSEKDTLCVNSIPTYLLTYLLTPWCRIFFEKVIVTQPVKE